MIKEVNKLDVFNEKMSEDNPFLKAIAYDEKGYILFNLLYDKIDICNVFVKEEYRNQKIASSLMEYLINYAKEKNVTSITLEVRCNNIYAIKLYEKYGFKMVAIREKYYNGIDGILYLKELVKDE